MARDGTESNVNANNYYIFNITACSVFLGVVSVNLLLFGWLSPYWFMLSTRAFTAAPELRVLGLLQMVEGVTTIDTSFFTDTNNATAKGANRRYWLASRRDAVCNGGSGASCGVDCQDMATISSVKVICTSEGGSRTYPMPILPAERILSYSQAPKPAGMPQDLSFLRYGCDHQLGWFSGFFTRTFLVCPDGYSKCPNSQLNTCTQGIKSWLEPACCINTAVIGQTLYNVTQAPTYVQSYGWTSWQAASTRESSSDGSSISAAAGDKWCTVQELRCTALKSFTMNGLIAFAVLSVAILLTFAACVLSIYYWGDHKVAAGVGGLYLAAGLLAIVGVLVFQMQTAKAVAATTTPRDVWGRPFTHPMKGYNDLLQGRTLLRNLFSQDILQAAEWTYLRINAKVNYATADALVPTGITQLEGATMALAGGVVAVIAAAVAIEHFFAARGRRPLGVVINTLAYVVLAFPAFIRGRLDKNAMAYRVLDVPWYQKFYPRAFTCGTRHRFPLDEIWDMVVCMPVHLIRICADNPSSRSIASPAEKEILRREGIHNDRLQSFLSSRRSFFIVLVWMGTTSFILNLIVVRDLSSKSVVLKSVASREVSYPIFQCELRNGACIADPTDTPDTSAIIKYLTDMMMRVVADCLQGSMQVEAYKGLMRWCGGFVATFCALGALSHWKDFVKSSRFVLVGWFCLVMTPVATSALSDAEFVDWKVVEQTVLTAGTEVYQEMIFFASHRPCDQIMSVTQFVMKQGYTVCRTINTFSLVIPTNIVKDCRTYINFYTTNQQSIFEEGGAFCTEVRTFFIDGPSVIQRAQDRLRQQLPNIMDFLRLMVALRSGLMNWILMLPAVTATAPALLQGALITKNMFPQQSLPAIMSSLPWAYTTLLWSVYQIAYQMLGGKMFLMACLLLCFGPLLYWVSCKAYCFVQPMCDQQAIHTTFRVWAYVMYFGTFLPYGMLVIYIMFINTFQKVVVLQFTLGFLLRPQPTQLMMMLTGWYTQFAYTVATSLTWFVDELVLAHVCANTPAILASTESLEEAEAVQLVLNTSIDLQAVEKGTYVCGGMADPTRVIPSAEGTWNEKIQVYVASLANKDSATLDCWACHFRKDPDLPITLAKSRRQWYNLLQNPPPNAFVVPSYASQDSEQRKEPSRAVRRGTLMVAGRQARMFQALSEPSDAMGEPLQQLPGQMASHSSSYGDASPNSDGMAPPGSDSWPEARHASPSGPSSGGFSPGPPSYGSPTWKR